MELTEEQVDWLVEHYVHPGRARGKIPPLEQSLLDLGLIKSEYFPTSVEQNKHFPIGDANIYVLSLIDAGWKEAARYRFAEIVEKYLDFFSEEAVERVMMGGLPLGALPVLLSSEKELVQKLASKRLEQLGRENDCGVDR